ncbi:hypothetical protein AX774_g7799 [Zancudomyces culisetae]|uniref:Uncharacterized protein n=1 Tax=Zancudomyces culisetae TaxID=1213189 RepID=A0A1R1PCU6_ZANCU|nr:hypothetical protein AX774_g7799 [Zancudomyces culisetae]|eukprot:OMH78804.1 hypothetical protein AX774_g7799 [Zancudomyces culisetae]
MRYLKLVFLTVSCIKNYVFSLNLQVYGEMPKEHVCDEYERLEHVEEYITRLEIFKDADGILAYNKVAYADEYKIYRQTFDDYFLKEICTSSTGEVSIRARAWKHSRTKPRASQFSPEKINCEYPYYRNGTTSVPQTKGPMNHFIEYKVCETASTCSITARTINLGVDEERNKPVEEGCVFSIYKPYVTIAAFLSSRP